MNGAFYLSYSLIYSLVLMTLRVRDLPELCTGERLDAAKRLWEYVLVRMELIYLRLILLIHSVQVSRRKTVSREDNIYALRDTPHRESSRTTSHSQGSTQTESAVSRAGRHVPNLQNCILQADRGYVPKPCENTASATDLPRVSVVAEQSLRT